MGIPSIIGKAAKGASKKMERVDSWVHPDTIPPVPQQPYMGIPAPVERPGYTVPAGPVGSPQDLMERANSNTMAAFQKLGMNEMQAHNMLMSAAEAGLLGSGATPKETMQILGHALGNAGLDDIKHYRTNRDVIRAIEKHGK